MKMSHLPACLWSLFVLLLCTVTCEVFYVEMGKDVKIPCGIKGSDMKWKYHSTLIIQEVMNRAPMRGSAEMASRASANHGTLHIKKVQRSDAGEYHCESLAGSQKHELRVMTCSVHSAGYIYEKDKVDLQCEVFGGVAAKWTCQSPTNLLYEAADSGLVNVPYVNVSHGGTWQCSFVDQGAKHSCDLKMTIIGLMPSPELKVKEGVSVLLPCVLHSKPWISFSSYKPTSASWEHLGSNPLQFLDTGNGPSETGELKWRLKSKGDVKNVKFSSDNLIVNFSVTLSNVKMSQTGYYKCSLKFGGGKSIEHELKLEVIGQGTEKEVQPGSHEVHSTSNSLMGFNRWIWIGIGIGCVVLVALVITTVILYQRHKRIKRKVKKMRSMKHPLMARDYCHCNRSATEQANGTQRERHHTAENRSNKGNKMVQQRSREMRGKPPQNVTAKETGSGRMYKQQEL